MNRQSQYEGLPSRPHDVSSRLHQLRSTSDSQLVVRPPGESDEVVISNIFSPLNSSSESSADHDRYAATTRRDEDACLREGPFAFGSPVSVAELNIFSASSTNNTTKDASKTTEDQAHLIPKVLKRRSRGVDSPKKTVDTRNVYVSAIVNATTTNSSSTTNGSAPGSGSKKSSLTSSLASSSSSDSVDSSASLSIHLEDLLDQLLAPTFKEPEKLPKLPSTTATRPTSSSHPVRQGPPPLIPRPLISTTTKKEVTSCHRRQNTSDSTRSAVAAVARGASKAAQEAASDPAIVLDRPVSCPRRQRTAESHTFPDVPITSNQSVEKNPKKIPCAKSPARIRRPRPPRHDCTKSGSSGSMLRMKRSVLKKAAGREAVPAAAAAAFEDDKPAACPLLTGESASTAVLPIREITVTPKILLEEFGVDDVGNAFAQDARDDDSFVLQDVPLLQEAAVVDLHPLHGDCDRAGIATTPSQTTIQTWLNMPQQRWTNSEPVLKFPSDPTESVDNGIHSKSESNLLLEQDRKKSGTICRQPSYDESTSCNDTVCDDRMFQAWLNLPPRVCTTHPDDKTCRVDTPTRMTIDIAEQWVAAAAVRPANSIGECDVSAIAETSTENMSLPSFFLDCRGLPTEGVEGYEQARTPIGSTRSVRSIVQEAAADLEKRLSLPPLMPHRRKPSFFMDDSIELESDQNKMVQSLWSSMPALCHSSLPPNADDKSRNLRSSWPTIRARLDSEDSACTAATTAPPSIPTRFRRQDSLLSEEADCETMMNFNQRSPSVSPTRRASLPPTRPHRRKPSLFLDDITTNSGDDDAYNNGKVESMWSSLPVFSKASLPPLTSAPRRSLKLPPSMPHRRKPSLNILEDGEEGMIEMWLTHDHSHGSCNGSVHSIGSTSPDSLPGGPPAQRHRRQLSQADSVCSIFLMEGEVEI